MWGTLRYIEKPILVNSKPDREVRSFGPKPGVTIELYLKGAIDERKKKRHRGGTYTCVTNGF